MNLSLGLLVGNVYFLHKKVKKKMHHSILHKDIWFNGISTLDGYLKLNPVYTHYLYMICE